MLGQAGLTGDRVASHISVLPCCVCFNPVDEVFLNYPFVRKPLSPGLCIWSLQKNVPGIDLSWQAGNVTKYSLLSNTSQNLECNPEFHGVEK